MTSASTADVRRLEKLIAANSTQLDALETRVKDVENVTEVHIKEVKQLKVDAIDTKYHRNRQDNEIEELARAVSKDGNSLFHADWRHRTNARKGVE